MKRIFAKNFLTIQVPPILKIKERRDGALIIDPEYGDNGSLRPTHTAVGSISKSDTQTHAGTSTDVGTSTSTSGLTILVSGKEVFPVMGASVISAQPKAYISKPNTNKESFELTRPIPQGTLEGSDDVRLVGEPELTDFTIENLHQPPLEDANVVLPDLGRLGRGMVAEASDEDNDSTGDTDDTTDSDNDNDSDDEPDEDSQQDVHDIPGGFAGLLKHVNFKPPLAPEGTTGRSRRRK